MNRRVMLVGVGGQGLLLTTRLLAEGLLRGGFEVRCSEVHGMAQRGGSVVTQVAFGERVYSPLAGPGAFDALVAMEKLEGLRHAHFLKKGGLLILNLKEIPPLPVLTGSAAYPSDVEERLGALPVTLCPVEADSLAAALGEPRAVNLVLLGVLVRLMGLVDLVDWEETVAAGVRGRNLEVNLAAFREGLRPGR